MTEQAKTAIELADRITTDTRNGRIIFNTPRTIVNPLLNFTVADASATEIQLQRLTAAINTEARVAAQNNASRPFILGAHAEAHPLINRIHQAAIANAATERFSE